MSACPYCTERGRHYKDCRRAGTDGLPVFPERQALIDALADGREADALAKHGPAADHSLLVRVLRAECARFVEHLEPALAALLAAAWDEGFKQGGPMHDENYDDPDAHTRNPYRATDLSEAHDA